MDYRSSKSLREHNAFLKDELDICRTSYESTQKELADAVLKIEQLNQEIARYAESAQTVIKLGAAFKKDASGYYSDVPLCPRCMYPLHGGAFTFPMRCAPCGHKTGLLYANVSTIVAELNENL